MTQMIGFVMKVQDKSGMVRNFWKFDVAPVGFLFLYSWTTRVYGGSWKGG